MTGNNVNLNARWTRLWLGVVMSFFSLSLAIAQPHPPPTQTLSPAFREEIGSKLVNNRMREVGKWTINELGQGQVTIEAYRGLAFDNRNIGIGNIRFKQGVHNFDIGKQGYALLKNELSGIVMGQLEPLQGYARDCGIEHPGFSEISWAQANQSGKFTIESVCALSPQMQVLREKSVNAWRILGWLMMRYEHEGVNEEASSDTPLARQPYKLSLSYVDVVPNVRIAWEINPDGRGWFETNTAGYRKSWTRNDNVHYLTEGRRTFDIGTHGYLRLRRELDAYILRTPNVKDCQILADGQPLIKLTWANSRKRIGERNGDDFCFDKGERIDWTIAFLGAGVAARPVTITSPKRQ
jgi:hypothetical protein